MHQPQTEHVHTRSDTANPTSIICSIIFPTFYLQMLPPTFKDRMFFAGYFAGHLAQYILSILQCRLVWNIPVVEMFVPATWLIMGSWVNHETNWSRERVGSSPEFGRPIVHRFSLAKEIACDAANERENAKSTSGTASASRVGAEVLRWNKAQPNQLRPTDSVCAMLLAIPNKGHSNVLQYSS